MQNEKTALVWFGNDLRVLDNTSLHLATSRHCRVIGIFCFQLNSLHSKQFGFQKMGSFRAKFLCETLLDLRDELHRLNITLHIELDAPHLVLPKFCRDFDVDTIYFQEEFTSEEIKEKNRVKSVLPSEVALVGSFDQFLYHPDDLPFAIDELPHVFTSFRKIVERKCDVLPECSPSKLSKANLVGGEIKIPSLEALGFGAVEVHKDSAFPFSGGSKSAMHRMDHYFFNTKKLGNYKQTRNGLVGMDYSSKLSAWLANGSVSARTIYWKVKAYEKIHGSSSSSYWLIFELIWRDFFKYMAMKHGNGLFLREGMLHKPVPWNRDEKLVKEWIEGRTGEPFVNANMIELKKTGWMSNRGRQNVASYFSKTLQLDWRIGAAYFEKMLIDFDVHSNYGNWQYVSGVGNDPRDRKFNVALQAERYDANKAFRNLWLSRKAPT